MLATIRIILSAALLSSLVLSRADLSLADTLVVCPDSFESAIKPWVDYRSQQGHKVRLIDSSATAVALRDRIRAEAAKTELEAILLIGDTGSTTNAADDNTHRAVPTHYVPARIITKFGGEKMIASDNPYADLDDDQIPDVPIGRLTADTPAELTGMIQRIIAYESSSDYGPWRSRINLIAGLGGFGGLIDSVIESTTKMFLTSGVPAGYQTSMTQASWRSPYCPDPRRFNAMTIQRMNEGCLFWIYMGHGHVDQLDRLNVPGAQYPILTTADVPQIDCRHHAPIALFFSCYSAAYDARRDCLAEELLRRDHGPVAVLGGSRVTMPYAMAALGSAMVDECFKNRRSTVGEIFHRAKQRLADDQPEDSRRKMFDSLGILFGSSSADLVAQRREHLHLFNLLGDPLLRMRYPREVDVSAPLEAEEGSEVVIQVDSPISGQATIELVVRRDRLTFQPTLRAQYEPSNPALDEYQATYLKANRSSLATVQKNIDGTPLEVRLSLPEGITGPCHARVFVEGKEEFAIGSADINVLAPPKEAAPQADGVRQAEPRIDANSRK